MTRRTLFCDLDHKGKYLISSDLDARGINADQPAGSPPLTGNGFDRTFTGTNRHSLVILGCASCVRIVEREGSTSHHFNNVPLVSEHSAAVYIAGILVSNSIRHASTFERDRVGNVSRLYRRTFNFPRSSNPVAKGAVCFRMRRSARADCGQATSDNVRPLCSPAS